MTKTPVKIEWNLNKKNVNAPFTLALCIQDVPVAYIKRFIATSFENKKRKTENLGYKIKFVNIFLPAGKGKYYKKLKTAQRNCLKEFNLYEDRIGQIHVGQEG